MLKFGLIGKNISYSKSPDLHHQFFKEKNIKAAYELFDLDENEIKGFLSKAWFDADFVGFNVTQPYKEKIVSILENQNSKSVNTIYRGKEKWRGASTDGEGFKKSFFGAGLKLEDFEKIIFLGAGGAIRSLQDFFQNKNRVFISRKQRKWMSNDAEWILWDRGDSVLNSSLDSSTLLIHGTNLGPESDDLKNLVVHLKNFKGVIFDLQYHENSVLKKNCNEHNISYIDGFAMLKYQAELSHQYWMTQKR